MAGYQRIIVEPPIQLIQFKSANAKGFGDYADGFIPSVLDNGTDQLSGCLVYEDIKHQLSDPDEKMLATAIYHIENGNPIDKLQAIRIKSLPKVNMVKLETPSNNRFYFAMKNLLNILFKSCC